MGKYEKDAARLLELVGGRGNIVAVTHCITRMRFVLKDPAQADVEGIKALPSAKGTFTQAGQFQVIIGNDVADFYQDFTAVSGIEGVSKEAVKLASKQNQNPLQRVISVIAEIFAPLIPAIIVGGLILGFRNCIDSLYLFEGHTKTLVEISQFWAGVDSFLWLIGEAVFHLGIPVGICWSVSRKMGTTQMLGIVLGLTLVSSQLLNAYAVAATPAADIPRWNFGYFSVNMIGYQAQVLPAIMAAFFLCWLERFFKRIIPQVVSMIFVPFFSLLIAVIAAHWVLGPIGWKLGSAISAVVYSGITGSFRVVFAAIFGFFYAPLVITGLHHMTNAIDAQLIADYQGTMLWPMIALSNIAQGSAVLAMSVLQKRNTRQQEVNVPACISCYLGVTEVAMFGVNLKYTFPFLCGMIGSACAAIISVGSQATANAIGVGGLPGILSMQPGSMGSFALAMLTAVLVPFALTLAIGAKKLSLTDRNGERETSDFALVKGIPAGQGADGTAEGAAAEQVTGGKGAAAQRWTAFVSGESVSIADVGDGVFSAGILGDGMAIRPSDELILAPCDGRVAVLMQESRHAIGLQTESGTELLIHVGLDTVEMKGEGFSYLVSDGQQVSRGTPLLRFERAKIAAAGKQDIVIMVLTEPGRLRPVWKSGRQVRAGVDEIVSFS